MVQDISTVIAKKIPNNNSTQGQNKRECAELTAICNNQYYIYLSSSTNSFTTTSSKGKILLAVPSGPPLIERTNFIVEPS